MIPGVSSRRRFSDLSEQEVLQDSYDIWDNHMPIAGARDGLIMGYKYFGFAGLDRAGSAGDHPPQTAESKGIIAAPVPNSKQNPRNMPGVICIYVGHRSAYGLYMQLRLLNFLLRLCILIK